MLLIVYHNFRVQRRSVGAAEDGVVAGVEAGALMSLPITPLFLRKTTHCLPLSRMDVLHLRLVFLFKQFQHNLSLVEFILSCPRQNNMHDRQYIHDEDWRIPKRKMSKTNRKGAKVLP